MFSLTRFNELRKAKGLTQRYIAGQIGRNSVIFHDWALEKSVPNPVLLQKVADILGTTPAYLMGLTDEKTPENEKEPLVNDDEELTELLTRVRDDPHLRMLFSITKDATAEDVEKAIRIIQALKGE